jgi:hypothetical protein
LFIKILSKAPNGEEILMNTLHKFLATEVTIRGQALDALTGLNSSIVKPGIEKAVKLRIRIRYPHKRFADDYEFPVIIHGEAEQAWSALEQLWRQRALTSEQHALLGSAISIAETFSQ